MVFGKPDNSSVWNLDSGAFRILKWSEKLLKDIYGYDKIYIKAILNREGFWSLGLFLVPQRISLPKLEEFPILS